MYVLIHFFSEQILIMTYSLPRIVFTFVFSGFMSRNVLSGVMRTCIILSINLGAYPITLMYYTVNMEVSVFYWFIILSKEIFIGIILGIVTSIGIWIFSIIGSIIDNHRGASFATMHNALNDNEDSVLSVFFVQLIVAIFFLKGFFLNFLQIIYQSFVIWPIFDFWPNINVNFAILMTQILVYIFNTAVVFSAPVILLMLVSEIGLAITNRFVPQLQVFFLSMPIKSGLAFFILMLYFWFLVEKADTFINYYQEIFYMLNTYFQPSTISI